MSWEAGGTVADGIKLVRPIRYILFRCQRDWNYPRQLKGILTVKYPKLLRSGVQIICGCLGDCNLKVWRPTHQFSLTPKKWKRGWKGSGVGEGAEAVGPGWGGSRKLGYCLGICQRKPSGSLREKELSDVTQTLMDTLPAGQSGVGIKNEKSNSAICPRASFFPLV